MGLAPQQCAAVSNAGAPCTPSALIGAPLASPSTATSTNESKTLGAKDRCDAQSEEGSLKKESSPATAPLGSLKIAF